MSPSDEITDDHGTRLHAAEGVGAGRLRVDYARSLSRPHRGGAAGRTTCSATSGPSRYCESDRLGAFARARVRRARTAWPCSTPCRAGSATRVSYMPGSSRPTDGAVATLLARQGVCRDFAHLVIALLRACDVPARLVSVYAPGLSPMDFHAVAEAHVDGEWNVVDATCLAPRTAMVRIATGRDAADTAFLSTAGDMVDLTDIDVTASSDGVLPSDDITTPAMLR